MTGKYLVDSNILIYAFDSSEKEKHGKAKEFIIKSSYENAAVSVQNLAEFYSNITDVRKPFALPSDVATEKLEDFIETFNVIKYGAKTLIGAAHLHQGCRIHFWDALLAATMLENKIRTIYTENTKDFSKVPGIRAVNPLGNT